VFRVGLTSNTTLRTLNRMICEFYGHPGTNRDSAAQLASHALDCVLSCGTRVGIIDDLHFIDPRRKDGLDVSNHLKWLANELPVTFIYAGVGLAERRFFAGCAATGPVTARSAWPPATAGGCSAGACRGPSPAPPTASCCATTARPAAGRPAATSAGPASTPQAPAPPSPATEPGARLTCAPSRISRPAGSCSTHSSG
jgi:hypothetical protein